MTQVRISSLGQRGEGIAEIDGQRVFVPFTLPDETVEIDVDGERGTLREVITASPHRIDPFCPYYGECGGCQLQHLDAPSYQDFKTGLVQTALRFAGIEAEVERFIPAHGIGRRRATLHARREGSGYMHLRSHEALPIDFCPILVPALTKAAPAITRAVYQSVGEADVSFTATLSGLDVAVRTEKKRARADALAPLITRFKLARLALNGEMLLQTQPPIVAVGKSQVDLPIGSFLQATSEAENILAEYVMEAMTGCKSIADLFCGLGPFTLRLAEHAKVYAADSDKAAIIALDKGKRFTRGLKEITLKSRDLFRDALSQYELAGFDGVVIDPPRAGAEQQVRELALSKVKTVAMISCDAKSFARDAAILVGGGYRMKNLCAVDQFAYSTHIEIAATFRR